MPLTLPLPKWGIAMANSLDAAVEAGTISAEAAFCGMQPSDIETLIADGYGGLQVLVRGHYGREVLSASRFYETQNEIDERLGGIRDVSGLALDVDISRKRSVSCGHICDA